MLRVIGGLVVLWVFWIGIALSVLLLAGCDTLVADNPACTYDCVSTQSYSRAIGG